MAYGKSWDEASPNGTENASTIDTIIQDVKIAVRERMEDILPDWANDGVDPKVLDLTKTFPIGKEQVGLSLTSAKTIATGTTLTAMNWDQADYEVGENLWLSGAGNEYIKVVNTGRYLVSANVRWTLNATGQRWAALRKNGVTLLAGIQDIGTSSNLPSHLSLSWMGPLTALDELEIAVAQDSGGNLDILVEGTNFTLMRIA